MRLADDRNRQNIYPYLAFLQVPGDTADRELQSRKTKVTVVVAQICLFARQAITPWVFLLERILLRHKLEAQAHLKASLSTPGHGLLGRLSLSAARHG